MPHRKKVRSHPVSLQHDIEEQRISAIADMNSLIVWRAAADGTPLQDCTLNDVPHASQRQQSEAWLKAVHPKDRERVRTEWRNALRTGSVFQAVYRLKQPDATVRWSVGRGVPFLAADGTVQEWLGTITDIQDRVEVERALSESEERLRLALESTHVGIWDHDVLSDNIWLSKTAAEILDDPANLPITKDAILNLVHPEDRHSLDHHLANFSKDTSRRLHTEARLLRCYTGKPIWIEILAKAICDEDGKPVRTIGTIRDISVQRELQENLYRIAHQDPLTGLANRTCLADHVKTVLSRSSSAIFLMMDLDGFKEVNDACGHYTGDQVLKLVSERLITELPANAFVSRIGGDEFVVILQAASSSEEVGAVTASIRKVFNEAFVIGDRMLSLGACIGGSIAPQDGKSSEELMMHADLALYEAKAIAPGAVCFYTPSLGEKISARQRLNEQLQTAVNKQEFELFYQSQVRLETGEVIGAEALLRWRHPQLGLMSPFQFLPVLKKSRWAPVVGDWIIRQACMDAAKAASHGVPFKVAVNLFSVQFRTGSVDRVVAECLAETGLPPELFEVEITENVLLANDELTIPRLKALRDLGCSIAFDDYGTGYASLGMLKRFPITRLKIDKSFVANIGSSKEDLAIVEAVLSLGRAFNLSVLAEGIETPAQVELLKQIGCTEGQGYLFGRPMPIQQIIYAK